MKYQAVKYLFSALILFEASSLSAADREVWNFNPGWSYTFAGEDHRNVTLPRAFNEDYAYKVLIDSLPTDIVTYTKTFKLPESAKGRKVFIEFEGARQGAEATLNGHYLGRHENGVMAFGFDLTPYLNYSGENNLQVVTDNDWDYTEKNPTDSASTFQWNNRNFNANYGGLPKNVRLHVTDRLYQTLPLYSSFATTGVYVYARDISLKDRRAEICVESEVKNETGTTQSVTLEVEMLDYDGKSISRFRSPEQVIPDGAMEVLKAADEVGDLHFWSWGYGYLYDVRTRLVVNGVPTDEVSTRTGFRATEFADGMLRLNDRVMMVHGYAQRTSNEWPGVGMSVPPWLSDYSNREMVRSGGNLVRWMHVAPWKQDVESCDRVGLLQALPAGDAEKDVEGRQWQQRVELMRDAIIYNRNNPSVIFYECGNKGISEAHFEEMKALRDLYDPHGGRAIGSREMLDSPTAEYGGEMLYINKSASKPMWAMEYCRDEGLRRYWDDYSYPYHINGDGPLYRNADASAYNLNADQLAVEHIRRWYDYWLVRPGTGRRVSSGGVKIIFSDTNTHCRGESNYRTSGVTDAMRIPKDSYYAHRVMWDGWVTPETSHTHIIGHWNYDEGTVKPIYVVSDAPRVSLLLNGQPIGKERTDYHFLHTFDSIPYTPGNLTAISLDEEGNILSEHTLSTAGEPSELRLSLLTAPGGMVADGADMALVEFEVVDNEGRRCPLDNRNVTFTLEGPAEWRGGIAKGEDNCILSTTLPVECGINRALLRSLPESGTVRLRAEAEGLPPSHIEWESAEVEMTGGLTSYAQSHTLPSNFERGETPATPSFRPEKRSLTVKEIIAGSNQPKAFNSIDDNETSEWQNDGRLSNAWITYVFDRPERIDEISLKLAGWRRQSYPIEIVADSVIIWEGRTERSLGYVHLPVRPTVTDRVTIRLKGAATASDAFGQITELAEKNANALDGSDSNAKEGRLRIVEADFLARQQ